MRQETILKNIKEMLGEGVYNTLTFNLTHKSVRTDKELITKFKKIYPLSYESLLEDIEEHIIAKRNTTRASNKLKRT